MIALEQSLFGTTFQNPILLAAGTCGFGRELDRVVELESLGGIVTKSVTLEPRQGNPPPRVTEFDGGMLNSIGLTNPGAEAVRDGKLPWIRDHLRRARAWVSVAGHTAEEYAEVVEILDGAEGFLGFEINLSCPNDTRLEGRPFALDRGAVAEVVAGVRERTSRPLLAKLAPNDPDVAATARTAGEAGANGVTLVNTLPGLLLDGGTGRPRLGAGAGGVSGPALRPVGLRAVREVRDATDLPLVGVGGVVGADDALAYLRAGASLVQVGTASFADPRAAARIVDGLRGWGGRGRSVEASGLVGGREGSRARPGEDAARAAPGGG